MLENNIILFIHEIQCKIWVIIKCINSRIPWAYENYQCVSFEKKFAYQANCLKQYYTLTPLKQSAT